MCPDHLHSVLLCLRGSGGQHRIDRRLCVNTALYTFAKGALGPRPLVGRGAHVSMPGKRNPLFVVRSLTRRLPRIIDPAVVLVVVQLATALNIQVLAKGPIETNGLTGESRTQPLLRLPQMVQRDGR